MYYALFHYTVKDMETFQTYPPAAIPTLFQYGGKILAATGPGLQDPAVIEGPCQHDRTVVLEFESQPAFERWYKSPEYQAVVGLRTSSSGGWVLGLPAFVLPA
jgi:uncharacterized protein (DUF1330 family)